MSGWGTRRGSPSLKLVAEILACEGFSARLASEIRRWYRKAASIVRVGAMDRSKRRWSGFAKDMTKAQNIAFGQFVNQMMEASLQAGVRLGLAARLFHPEERDPEFYEAGKWVGIDLPKNGAAVEFEFVSNESGRRIETGKFIRGKFVSDTVVIAPENVVRWRKVREAQP